MADAPRTRAQREHMTYMVDAMRRFEYDMHETIWLNRRIPEEWFAIAKRQESAKVKVGFSCDEDVVKWFRSMGPGYQRRMCDVLRAFMHGKLAGVIHAGETLESYRWPDEVRPEWGQTGRERERGRGR
ncbi:hypothetical protein HKCCE2091_20150 [Rhodobacterales bacterium HKCCE2091]|nr:hypothetical protein [Rhodobacterales bacterium HKCCE2091]